MENEIITQQQIREDLSTFDIDDHLMGKKERLDKRIQQFQVKVQALKLARGYSK